MDEIYELFDQYPAIPACMGLFVLFMICLNFKRRRQEAQALLPEGSCTRGSSPVFVSPKNASRGGLLSDVLYRWSPRDPFPVRDLLRSVAIFGASGSGKTSGSGFQIARAVVRNPRIGGLIIASKLEDREFWQRVFHQAGRKHDLLVFSPESPLRFNFLDFVQRSGDTRDITQAIMVIGETLEMGRGRESEPFWRQQYERMIYNAVEIVLLATGKVTAPDLQRFINGAAQDPDELAKPEWQAGFHNQCLKAAFGNHRTPVQKHDYALASDYWLKEYPAMADKTRSSILAGVMGILHVFNTGIVRELVSTTTNVSPAVMDQGKWVLVDMPISSDGAAGALVLGGWKYLTQRHILKRHATENTPACVIWADEAQKVVNSFDSAYLAECRSHRGCMVYLTQSIHAFYSRMREGGEHDTDALLTNFYHKVFHALGDDKSASFAGSLIGKRARTRFGGSMTPSDNAYDELFGPSRLSPSWSEHVENILENREFMQGLRTGGPENGFMVDGIVVRSGEPFANGEAWMRVAFSQND